MKYIKNLKKVECSCWNYLQLKIVLRLMKYALYVQCVQEKRLPFEVKQQCQAFEFECFNSLMSPKMRNSLLHGHFLCLRCKLIDCSAKKHRMGSLGPLRELKHSNLNVRR